MIKLNSCRASLGVTYFEAELGYRSSNSYSSSTTSSSSSNHNSSTSSDTIKITVWCGFGCTVLIRIYFY